MTGDELEWGGVRVARDEQGGYEVALGDATARRDLALSFEEFRTLVRSLGPSVLGTDPRLHSRDDDDES